MIAPLSTEAEKSVRHWFVMRAYKNEKLAEEKLNGFGGLPHFIPKQYVVRSYHGVKSKRLVPVIPSLLFVYASHAELTRFKKEQYNPLQFVTWTKSNGINYLMVPDEQMRHFIQFATQQIEPVEYYKPEEIQLTQGTRVRIHGGTFDGIEGVFVKIEGKRDRRVVVLLDGIMAIAAKIRPDLIEVIK